MDSYKKELNELLAGIGSSQSMGDLLGALLTDKEYEEIARRVQIVKQLKSGIPQREIAASLGVGIATVTRGARELKLGKFREIG